MLKHFPPTKMDIPSLTQALEAAQRIFPCEQELLDKVPLPEIVRFFQKDLLTQQTPFLIRIAGQSGSGKSSQLLPSVKIGLEGRPYIQINVGAFARFHPMFESWQKTAPNEVREKTNGFALRALIMFYDYCVSQKVNIILDMTLLEPEIDLFLMGKAKKQGYRIQTHVLCVPKKISDRFIRQRQKQTGRQVLSRSASYFFKALAPSLKCLTHSQFFTAQDGLVLWSHYRSEPICKTTLTNPSALRVLGAYRGNAHLSVRNPTTLFKSKCRWMRLFMKEV